MATEPDDDKRSFADTLRRALLERNKLLLKPNLSGVRRGKPPIMPACSTCEVRCEWRVCFDCDGTGGVDLDTGTTDEQECDTCDGRGGWEQCPQHHSSPPDYTIKPLDDGAA